MHETSGDLNADVNAGVLKDGHDGENGVDDDNGTVCSEFTPSSPSLVAGHLRRRHGGRGGA